MTLLLLSLLAAGPITVAEIHDLVDVGRGEEALARAESAALADPSDRPMQKAYALLLRNSGALDSANAIYDRLLAADPSDDDTRLGKAIALSWQGQFDAALALYAEVRPESESYFEALVGKGRVASWAGRYREALRYLDEAESLSPGNREVLERRAQVLSWSGDRVRAISLYRRLNQLVPDNPDYLFALGQNHEWSDLPVAARRYYRRALALAPRRAEFLEADRRVAEAAAPSARVEFSNASDDDGGVRGTYREYRFRYEQPLGDRLRPSGALTFSSNRRGILASDFLLARAGLAYHPLDWLRLNGQVQGDALRFAFKAATLNCAVERAWLSWSAEAGRVMYEPTQDIGAFSGWTALTARPLPGLKFDARAARIQIIDDGNVKNSLSAGAGFDLLKKPRLTIAYAFNFDSFREKSPLYYSPRNLVTNSLGLRFDSRWTRTGVSAAIAGGINAAQEWVCRADAALDYLVLPGTRVTLDANYAQTTGMGRYQYGSVAAGVVRSF